MPVVAIVGYTNAGKSTLLNTLTGSEVLAEDKLFATLDTRSRRLWIPSEHGNDEAGREVVLVDTVGFIRDLPEDLFAAFRATFEEAADADLLLHVVDASDPAREEHIRITEGVLTELGLSDRPRLLVFNKVDLLGSPAEAERWCLGKVNRRVLSAVQRDSARGLLLSISQALGPDGLAETLPPQAPPDEEFEPFVVDGAIIAPPRQMTF